MKHVWQVFSMALCGSALLFGCGGTGDDTQTADDLELDAAPSEQTPAPGAAATVLFPSNAAALVNDQTITADELATQLRLALSQLDPAAPPDEYTISRLREDALTELVKKALIAQQAEKQKVTVTEEEFQQRVRQVQEEYGGQDIQTILQDQGKSYEVWAKAQRDDVLLDKLVDLNMSSMILVGDEEARQYYEKNKEKYDHPAQVRASQILTFEPTVADTALQEIRNGADFAATAQKYSESEDAEKGGDLGFFEQGVMPQEFDEVIFALTMDEVSGVVKTPYGYQIFKLTGQRAAQRVSFEDAQAQIKTMLKKQKRMFAYDLWIGELQKNAKILLNQQLLQQIK